ncbi:MAG: hypothetical protein AAGA88_14810 [Pseudomonadota bacterium]
MPDSSLTAIRVGHVRRVVVVSPDYLAVHGRPEAPDELTKASDNRLGRRRRGPALGLRGGGILSAGRCSCWLREHNDQYLG